ncbi:MAG TPA: PAS domain S-box protein [Terriglobales bacterium]|jgi:PAS domain S-box-containing protein|nr:PAS domain S-box protein [Terriglobales bacterium]
MLKPSAVVPPVAPLGEIKSSDVFSRLVETVSDYAIFVLDPSGNISSWNPGAQRLKGYSAGEIIGKHFSVFYTAADLAKDKPAYELAVASKVGRFEDEGWRVRKDGSRFWANVVITRLLDDDGRLIGFGKITRDLSERRLSELRYRLLIDGITDYAIFFLDSTGHVTSWNSGAQRIKGYAPDEIIGKHFSAFYPDEDRKAGLPETVLRTAEKEGHFEGEGWRVRKDGSKFWANVVVTALRDEEGALTGFSKITRDLTDRKLLLDELKRHAAELELRVRERDESNAELEAFAYSVSHDLRAPLRAISGFADALREDCAQHLNQSGLDYVKEISDASRRMNSLVQDLIEYGRLGRISAPLASVNLLNAINEARRQLGDAPAGSLKVDVAADLFVCAHPQMLTQVIYNLLSNALKFHKKDSFPQVCASAEEHDGVVRLNVRDNGIGIAPEHQERIWNVFERLYDRETYAGTGIGLAIVKRATDRMDGSSGVISHPGDGSTFWIELPRGPGN